MLSFALLVLAASDQIVPNPALPAPVASPAVSPAPDSSGIKVVTLVKEEQRQHGVHLSGSLAETVGTGTFYDPNSFAYIGSGLTLSASYGFKVKDIKLALSGREFLAWEFTKPQNPTGRQYSWSDASFSLAAPRVYTEPRTKVSVSPSLGLSVPLSLESQVAGSITNLSAAASFGRLFFHERINTSLRLAVGHGFFTKMAGGISASQGTIRDPNGNLVFLARASDVDVSSTGMNTAWSLASSIGVDFQLTDKLSASAGFGLSTAWHYAAADQVDPYTPRTVDSNGQPVACTGMCRADRMTSSFSVGYSLTPRIDVSANLNTAQPPKTMDDQRFRFPFFDTQSWALNYTTFSLSMSVLL